jgi:putative SOS response-associated peptidase YedK
VCYNIAFLTKRQETYEKRYGARFQSSPLPPVYHTSGFAHPEVPVLTSEQPGVIQTITWGFVPEWAKDLPAAVKFSNQALNARAETVFEKPMFREAILHRRCVVVVDAFFEHQHIGKQTIPYGIFHTDASPIGFAGIYSYSRQCQVGGFSILTVQANETMQHIHNANGSEAARMPLILPLGMEKEWLSARNKDQIASFFLPYPAELLTCYPVARLSGKNYPGNIASIWDRVEYPSLPA